MDFPVLVMNFRSGCTRDFVIYFTAKGPYMDLTSSIIACTFRLL